MPTVYDLLDPLQRLGHAVWTTSADNTDAYVFPKGLTTKPGKDVPVLRVTVYSQSLRVWCYTYRHEMEGRLRPFQGFSPSHSLTAMKIVESFYVSEHTSVEAVLETIATCGAAWLEAGVLGVGTTCNGCPDQLKCLAKTYRYRPLNFKY